MSHERFPSQEPSQEKHETRELKWRELRKFLFAGSLLLSGGMVGEYTLQQHDEVKNLEKGGKQTFSIDQKDYNESTAPGRRGDFSIQKGQGGDWIVEGEIDAYSNGADEKDTSRPMHKVRYELPSSLSAQEVEKIFQEFSQSESFSKQGKAQLDQQEEGTRPKEAHERLSRALGLRPIMPMDRLISLAKKGVIEFYPSSYERPVYSESPSVRLRELEGENHEDAQEDHAFFDRGFHDGYEYRLEVDTTNNTAIETKFAEFAEGNPPNEQAGEMSSDGIYYQTTRKIPLGSLFEHLEHRDYPNMK